MKLFQTGTAGTLESSDCMAIVFPSDSFSLEYNGANRAIFAKRTEMLVRGVLEANGISGAGVVIQDQGAIEITIKARLETALRRAARGG